MKKIIVILVAVVILGGVFAGGIYFEKKMNKTDLNLTGKANTTNNSTESDLQNNNPPISQIQNSDDRIGTQAPDITATDINDKNVSLKDFKGKKVLLNFWASWCPPCRAEMPTLQKLYNESNQKGFAVLEMNLGETKDTVKSFLSKNRYTFPVLLDPDQEYADMYRIMNIPTSFFIDKDGVIRDIKVGELSKEDVNEFLNMK